MDSKVSLVPTAGGKPQALVEKDYAVLGMPIGPRARKPRYNAGWVRELAQAAEQSQAIAKRRVEAANRLAKVLGL